MYLTNLLISLSLINWQKQNMQNHACKMAKILSEQNNYYCIQDV